MLVSLESRNRIGCAKFAILAQINQLRRIYGDWPPKNFETLDESQKVDFFNKIKETSDSKKLKLVSESYIATTINDCAGKILASEYLPLSVWKERGFTEEEVLRSKDTQQHSVLGTLYGLELLTKYLTHEERQQRTERTLATDRVVPAGVPNGGKMPAGSSKEERQAAKEVIHVNSLINQLIR